jgi:hypothetical protein
VLEESIDIICQRLVIIKEYNDLIHDMNFQYRICKCYFRKIFDYELNKWIGANHISHENYDYLKRTYPKYKLYTKIISFWEANHHVLPPYSSLEKDFKRTFEIYESNDYVVLIDERYSKFKYFAKHFKFKPPLC